VSVVAVDVGGTTIKGAVVDASGAMQHELRRPTPASQGPEAVVAEIVSVVRDLCADGADAVSVVVPGVVDSAAGRAEFAANVGFRGVPLRDILIEASGLPVSLEHDVRAAGVAERTLGVAGRAQNYVLAVIGTGIAGVIVIDGKPLTGTGNAAGELGHMPVWPEGEECPCGQRGCLERYASAASIARRYVALGGEPGSAAQAVAERRESDPAAAQAWAEATQALGIALATCTMLLDPALLVLAGGLSVAGDILLAPVREALAGHLRWREPPPTILSTLGSRAGLLGAAVLGWRLTGMTDFEGWRT
jgi:glucokinase